jgi:2-polyprenyl-3-methyl-5-hydroxy-6-metoxy-1,4-benzoquinol methylase
VTGAAVAEFSDVAQRWRAELAGGGYERSIASVSEFQRLGRLSRTWRNILRATRLPSGASVFEFGCGGGNQLVPLALRGYRCAGIDCSEDVLERCRALVAAAGRFAGRPLPIELHHGEFLRFDTASRHDLVFNVGVVEHFIDADERQQAVARMFALCAPRGHVVSVVPAGTHPLRARVRAEGLGGYRIPEIDYTPALLASEMRAAGAATVRVIPHNLFGYRLVEPARGLRRRWNALVWAAGQLLPRRPGPFAWRHAASFIGVARKA